MKVILVQLGPGGEGFASSGEMVWDEAHWAEFNSTMRWLLAKVEDDADPTHGIRVDRWTPEWRAH